MRDLLRKRVIFDQVTVSGARCDELRETPGHKLHGRPVVNEPESPPNSDSTAGTIDNYLKNAKVWKERLALIRSWLEKLSGTDASDGESDPISLDDRLRARAAATGYSDVKAVHLIEDTPAFAIAKLVAEGVEVPWFNGETVDFRVTNISSQPALMLSPLHLAVISSGGMFKGDLTLESTKSRKGGSCEVEMRGLQASELSQGMKLGHGTNIEGGTVDIALSGSWTRDTDIKIDFPLIVTLRDLIIGLGDSEPVRISAVNFSIGVRGPIINPKVTVDHKQLRDEITKVGIEVAKDKVKERAFKEIEDALGDKLPVDSGNILKGIFGRSPKK